MRGVSRLDPNASATASASATPALRPFGILANPELPTIEGARHPSDSAPAAASSAPAVPAVASSAPAAPVDPFAHAKVVVGAVHVERVASADVLAVLPVSRFGTCYMKALAARGSAVGGNGTLHLAIDSTGHVGGTSFAGPPELASIGQCVANAAVGLNVKHVEGGPTAGDVDIAFQPE